MLSRDTPETIIYLIRHGHTIWNEEDRMRGQLDVPLSPLGIRQAIATGQVLAPKQLDVIYSGPLSRTRHPAREIARFHDLEPIVCEGLHDFNFGAWQGLLRTEIRERWQELYQLYDERPEEFQAPGGGIP